MSWRDDLEKVLFFDGRNLIGASFRGVPFFVDSSSRSGGRRAFTHEIMGSDIPVRDDLGRKAIDFRVDGYVLGDDYVRHRNALLDALENTSGPGELIHPFYGRRRVQCGEVTVRESIRDGGMAVISIEFLDAPLTLAPIGTTDLRADLLSFADLADIANEEEFVATFDVAGQPSFATTSLRDDLAGVAAALGEALAPICATTQELALLSVEIDLIAADASAIVRSPVDTLAALSGAIGQLTDSLEAAPRKVVDALITTYLEPAPPAVLGTTSTRAQERANQIALSDALRRLLIIYAARLLPDVTFETLEDATALRGTVVDAIDELAATAGNATYPALLALRSAVLRAVPGDAVLARVRTVERKTAVPSLLLSYQLYGSVEKESAVVARNGIQHPGFISGEIQVLSDDV